MNVKISDKSCSIKHPGKLPEQDIGGFRLKTRTLLIRPFGSTEWERDEKVGR